MRIYAASRNVPMIRCLEMVRKKRGTRIPALTCGVEILQRGNSSTHLFRWCSL